ncbi:MAG: triose-phosphate isomerase [Pseudomonadota bacterium]|nr:triose-phosphate isomerase [Pseudomonadota bacterium]
MSDLKPPRQPWVIGNWKMHPASPTEAVALATALAKQPIEGCQLAVAPTLLHLLSVQDCLRQTSIRLAAQDLSIQRHTGAHTGDVSADILHAAGVDLVLVGHSERRMDHQEHDGIVTQKLMAAASAGLTVVLCIGEQLSQREAGQAEAVVLTQLTAQLEQIPAAVWQAQILVAYEPVWAIGTGRTASPADAQQMHAAIRTCLRAYDIRLENTPILYGGSVKPDNAASLAACADIDGALVGGAALEAASFLAIAQAFANLP